MKRPFTVLVALLFCSLKLHGQEARVLSFIQSESDIKEGGSGLFEYGDNTYVITISPVVVGKKSESDCKIVGATKAKRDMISFINGSEITSYTELSISETVTESLEAKKVEANQTYQEVIKEKVIGTINEVKNLGGWYSDDKSVYYYAIYKIIE